MTKEVVVIVIEGQIGVGKTTMGEILEQELELEGLSPVSKYECLFAYLRDWDYVDEDNEYEAKRFLVTDWNEFTSGIYANVKEVRFDVNW